MRAVLTYVAAWLFDGHAGECAGCGQHRRVRSSIDGLALLCRPCDRRSFGSVPFSKGRI